MKRRIPFFIFALCRRAGGIFDHGPHGINIALRCAKGGKACHGWFDFLTDFHDFERAGFGGDAFKFAQARRWRGADKGALSLSSPNQTFTFKQVKRLTQGATADIKLFGKMAFGDDATFFDEAAV